MRLKLSAGLILGVAFLLPQYTCSAYRDPAGKIVPSIPAGANARQYFPFRKPHYAWEFVEFRDPASLIVPAAFLWPIPLLVFSATIRSQPARWLLWLLEPFCLAGSVYVIGMVSDVAWVSGAHRAGGAYVAFAGAGIYGAAWLKELWSRWHGSSAQHDTRIGGAA